MDKVKHNLLNRVFLLSTLLTFFFLSETYGQQKVQFTQYMFNGLVLNPAYAGADDALSLSLTHRSQWAGVEGAPSTQTLSAHTLFKKKNVGLGLIITNDRIGVHNNFGFLSNYAYHLKTGSSSYLSFGLQAGIHNRRSDYASIFESSGSYPNINNAAVSHTYFDFGAGLYFRSADFHIGFSVPEIIPQQISINDSLSTEFSELQFFLFSKYNMKVNDDVSLEPNILIKYFNGVPLSYDININFIYRKVLTTGLSYRKTESFNFLLKMQVTPQLQLGYSYDYPLNRISNFHIPSHEVMIHYLFRFEGSNVSSPR